jgi:hypothetical protein
VIDFSAISGEKKHNSKVVNNDSVIGTVLETLTNKKIVDPKPTVIELPLTIVRKEEPKK